VRRVERERSLPVVILRPATVYGPRSVDVVGKMAKALRAGTMLVVDGGARVAGLCYIDNLVDAALLVLRHDAAPGHAFNISDGVKVTWKQFLDDLGSGIGGKPVRLSVPYWLANALGSGLEIGYRRIRETTKLRSQPLLSRQAVQVLGRDQSFSTRKAQEVLGWNPRVDYDTGLRSTIEWLQQSSSVP
jgi:nucleoside-diphosphate-sugar epimerase